MYPVYWTIMQPVEDRSRLNKQIAPRDGATEQGETMIRMKAELLCGVAASLCLATAAQAAETAETAAGGSTVEEVIVTAQKREENLTKVPISITVVSQRTLEATASKNLVQLQGVVPGVTIEGDRSYGGATIAIRGTSGATTPLQDDPVAIYVDGVYTAPNLFGTSALSDISSLEIVRGPQGTLQGRNATAGAILVRTADPSESFGGYARASIADPLQWRLQGAVTGPLGEHLSGRLSVDYVNDRGWVTNSFDDTHLGGQISTNVRGTLMWRGERFKARLTADWQRYSAKEALARWAHTNVNPLGQAVTVPTPNVPLSPAEQQALEDGHFNQDVATFYRTEGESAALEMSYDLGPADIVSITGANRYDTPGQTDSAGINVAPRAGYNIGRLKGDFISEELRVQSNGEGPLKWLVGGYVSQSKSSMNFNIFNQQFTSPANIVSRFDAHQKNPSAAAFADATFNLTPKFAVTGGVRYTEESKDFRNTFAVQSVTTGGFLVGPLAFNPDKKSWNDTSYRAKATFSPTDDSLLYVSYSRGFKSGGFNAFTVGFSNPFNPETLTSTEVGVKADFLEHRAHIAASAYDNSYENLQVTIGVPTGGVVITNAASATIRGFEVEGQLRATDHLLLEANAAYTDGKYDEFKNAPNIVGVLVDASGNRLPVTPRWQYFLQATYDFPLAGSWSGQAQLNWRWRDTVLYSATDQTPSNLRSKPDGELGGRIKFTDDARQLSLSVYGANLTNERVINSLALAFAYPLVSFNRPRTVGVEIEKKF